MKLFFTTLIFGAFLILWGLSLIFESIFGFSIPLLKIGFALLLIYAGILLIKGIYPSNHAQKSIFFAKEHAQSGYQDYKVAFSDGLIDLSDTVLDNDECKYIKIHSVCANTVIKLNNSLPTTINAYCLFAAVTFPDKTLVSMGNHTYYSHNKDDKPKLIIDITAIFSAVEVKK